MDAELTRILTQVPELAGADPDADVTPIEGGLTNHNFRVTTPDGDYVVRISVREASELGIDRDNEHHNSLLAAEVGVGAPVLARVREPEALVVRFVEGVTMSPPDFAEPRRVSALAETLRTLHTARPFARDFNMVDVQARYHANRHGERVSAAGRLRALRGPRPDRRRAAHPHA